MTFKMKSSIFINDKERQTNDSVTFYIAFN